MADKMKTITRRRPLGRQKTMPTRLVDYSKQRAIFFVDSDSPKKLSCKSLHDDRAATARSRPMEDDSTATNDDSMCYLPKQPYSFGKPSGILQSWKPNQSACSLLSEAPTTATEAMDDSHQDCPSCRNGGDGRDHGDDDSTSDGESSDCSSRSDCCSKSNCSCSSSDWSSGSSWTEDDDESVAVSELSAGDQTDRTTALEEASDSDSISFRLPRKFRAVPAAADPAEPEEIPSAIRLKQSLCKLLGDASDMSQDCLVPEEPSSKAREQRISSIRRTQSARHVSTSLDSVDTRTQRTKTLPPTSTTIQPPVKSKKDPLLPLVNAMALPRPPSTMAIASYRRCNSGKNLTLTSSSSTEDASASDRRTPLQPPTVAPPHPSNRSLRKLSSLDQTAHGRSKQASLLYLDTVSCNTSTASFFGNSSRYCDMDRSEALDESISSISDAMMTTAKRSSPLDTLGKLMKEHSMRCGHGSRGRLCQTADLQESCRSLTVASLQQDGALSVRSLGTLMRDNSERSVTGGGGNGDRRASRRRGVRVQGEVSTKSLTALMDDASQRQSIRGRRHNSNSANCLTSYFSAMEDSDRSSTGRARAQRRPSLESVGSTLTTGSSASRRPSLQMNDSFSSTPMGNKLYGGDASLFVTGSRIRRIK